MVECSLCSRLGNFDTQLGFYQILEIWYYLILKKMERKTRYYLKADYLNFRHYIPTYLLQNFFHAKWVGVGFNVQNGVGMGWNALKMAGSGWERKMVIAVN